MAEFQKPLHVNDLIRLNTFVATNEELRSMYCRRKISKWIMTEVQRYSFLRETFLVGHKFNINHNTVIDRIFAYVRNIDDER